MPGYIAQCITKSQTGVSRDDNVTTFALDGIPTLNLSQAEAWVDMMKTFFGGMLANGAMCGRAQIGHRVKIYNYQTPKPNLPLFDLPWSFTTLPPPFSLPPEVQLCISYSNSIAVTIPRARRRGRIYIGGWADAKNVAGRPVPQLPLILANTYLGYVQQVNGIPGFKAAVFSRSQLNTYPVDTVYVDNEWDTMRSRGGRSTARATVQLP